MLKVSVVLLLVVVACATAFPGEEILNIDDEEVKAIANKGAELINEEFSEQFYLKLFMITEASRWPPTGEIYMRVLMVETTCKKEEVTYEEGKQCDIHEGEGAYKTCRVNFAPKQKYRSYYVNCFKM